MRLASVSTRAKRYKNELCYSIIFNSCVCAELECVCVSSCVVVTVRLGLAGN